MIIDSHAHLLAPEEFYAYKARLQSNGGHHRGSPAISDEALSASAAKNLRLMGEVGTDVQLLSPRPFHLMTSAKPEKIVHWWVAANNDLIARTVSMHPTRFGLVAGLPLCSGRPVGEAFEELDRVVEMGAVGVLLNPDPGEGLQSGPALGDEYWFPLYERLAALDLPALIHSAGCFSGRETYSEHFVTEESVAILSVLRSSVFETFPGLKLIVSHGGGSVPYQLGRWQAERFAPHLGGSGDAERFEDALRRFWFDSVLHYPPALAYLIETVGSDRVLFGTERPGSGSVVDPRTGRQLDDLKGVVEKVPGLDDDARSAIFEGNARQVFGRLKL